MHHAWANKLVQAWLAGNARESRFLEARLRTPFCIVAARLRDLTRKPNKSWLHYKSLSSFLATLPITPIVSTLQSLYTYTHSGCKDGYRRLETQPTTTTL